jgi:hypothetical protein
MKNNNSTTLDTVAMCLIIGAMAILGVGHLLGFW